MSSYASSYSVAIHESHDKATTTEEFRQEYPTLASVFEGVQGDGNGTPGVSAATISLFWEGGILKFCINPKIGNRVAFGSVRDPVKGLAALEAALCQGQFEWKISRKKN